jgi:hypothetical protein
MDALVGGGIMGLFLTVIWIYGIVLAYRVSGWLALVTFICPYIVSLIWVFGWVILCRNWPEDFMVWWRGFIGRA